MILENNSFTHIFFRCHNRSFFFRPKEVKIYILKTLAKYKARYGVEIFDFIIMDNHLHMVVRAKDILELGNYMRTVNSLIARFINKFFERDSQALRERYKSPMISDPSYLVKAIQYVYLNRYKIDKSDPKKDPFCSASWRVGTVSPEDFSSNDEESRELRKLLDPYSNLPIHIPSSAACFVRRLIESAKLEVNGFFSRTFTNSHTIGDEDRIKFRGRLLTSLQRFSAFRV